MHLTMAQDEARFLRIRLNRYELMITPGARTIECEAADASRRALHPRRDSRAAQMRAVAGRAAQRRLRHGASAAPSFGHSPALCPATMFLQSVAFVHVHSFDALATTRNDYVARSGEHDAGARQRCSHTCARTTDRMA